MLYTSWPYNYASILFDIIFQKLIKRNEKQETEQKRTKQNKNTKQNKIK